MFYRFEAEIRNKQIRCSLFFCCQPSYIAAPTVPYNHNPDIW